MGNNKTGERIARSLYIMYLLSLFLCVVFVLRIFYLQFLWSPNKELEKKLTQNVKRVNITQIRGDILADDGRPLAVSYPMYQLYIDCYFQGPRWEKLEPNQKTKAINNWKSKAALFAEGLEEAFAPNGKSAEEYKKILWDAFDKKKHYLKLGKPISYTKLQKLKTYPLIDSGRYKGGVWSEVVQTRRYPYGSIARKTLGRFQNETASGGIEGKFDKYLKGQEGHYYIKKTDGGYAVAYDSLYVDAINGQNIRTTLNVDMQDIAHRAVYKQLETNTELQGACFVIMEVQTGAIKAMVNLSKDSNDNISEMENLAVTWLGEPGSVFKPTNIMTMLEAGHITSLTQTIPSNNGKLPGYKTQDKHITDYERKHKTKNVPLDYCLQVSSNYAFQYLAKTYYETNPKAYTDKLYSYHIAESFDFDVEEKITKPSIPTPFINDSTLNKRWTRMDLTQQAIGYAVNVTPMHLLMFYNAIANDGKMMKPYLVESIEEHGKVVKKLGPTVLDKSICSKATADTLTRGLTTVTLKDGPAEGIAWGTAWRLSDLPFKVAGKTGTAHQSVGGRYNSEQGHVQQGTFAGFFPADNPKYTTICCIYTKFTHRNYYGGTIPVIITKEVLEELYKFDSYFYESL